LTAATADRAAAVRSALRRLVADHGLHGASMAAVAKEAGVATGTAYVHYASKDDLLLAAYLELKVEVGRAAVAGLDRSAPAEARFTSMWRAVHGFLAADPTRARFLTQVESSPLAAAAHVAALAAGDDPVLDEAAASDLADRLRPLPLEVLWDLGFGPAVRLVASGRPLDDAGLTSLADACWQAITEA
jgi:AcrR family transcriptional regulator